VDTGLDHLAHHFVLGFVTFTLEFPACNISVLNGLFHQLKHHRNRGAVAVVQRVEKVDAFDATPAAMVKVPAHQLALVGPGFLLNRVVKDQHVVVTLN
jgi:hypothetical protein